MAKILVIDDNEAILKTLTELFKFFNYEVLTALNGKEGIRVAELHEPDLIILDALMPEMNGFDTCKYLKSHPHLKHIPVIFLSANYTDEESRITGLEMGADDYLLKPFNTRELVAKVKSLLKRKYIIDNLREANKELLRIHDKVKKELESVRAKNEQQNLINIDPLTGIYTREYFLELVEKAISSPEADRDRITLSLISLDNLDTFVQYFDEPIFNYLLIKLINTILKNCRNKDIIGKIQQNRLAIFSGEVNLQQAKYSIEKIRAALSDENLIEMLLDEIQAPLNKKAGIPPIQMSAVIVNYDPEMVTDAHRFLVLANQKLEELLETGSNKTLTVDLNELKTE